MIVECIKIINPNNGKISEKSKDFGLIIGCRYIVLDIFAQIEGPAISYGIYDNSDTPISCNAEQFKIVDNTIPSNWGVKIENGKLFFAPKKWLDKSLWKYSFWEDYHSWENPEAEKCFQEEVALMIEESGFKEETR